MGKRINLLLLLLGSFTLKAATQLHPAPAAMGAATIRSIRVLPQNFYIQHMPFTCKKEGQLQKITGLNLFLRLGTKDHVDYLEQKPNARKF